MTAHEDPRRARTPSREQLSSYFFWIFDEAVPFGLHIHMLLDCVVWLCCIPFMGNDPPQLSGTGVVALCVYFLRQSGRRGDRR